MTRAFSGRQSDSITVEAIQADGIGLDDLRIHPEALRHQAEVAEAHGRVQLAANLRRAAEMTRLGDDEVLRIYEALRPRRSSAEDLRSVAEELDRADAPLCAGLVREALEHYERRGLLR